MTADAENHNEPDGDDMIAAEYVLGVLPAEERSAVARRMESDVAFARLVDHWENRLSPMAAGFPEIEPPLSVKAEIDRRLQGLSRPAAAAPAGFWSSLAFWRGLAAAAVAALLLVVALPAINPPTRAPQPMMVASLAADGSDVKYMVVYDKAQNMLGMSHLSGERAPERDFELWMIEDGSAPVSMGVIPVGASTHMTLEPAIETKLAAGAVLAVSLEPMGGSPTGLPTGPVVAAGDLRSI